MKIVHLSAELAPVAKVGGLGDVLQGLCRTQDEVLVILPKYDVLDLNGVRDLVLERAFETFSAWSGFVQDIPVILIESHDPSGLFDRGTIYGCEDDARRFTFFVKCALEYLAGSSIDILHVHDWHTALAAPFGHELGAQVIFTIHNLAYQGECSADILEKFGWSSEHFKIGEHYNLLQAGLYYADHVTTVSPTYAEEVLASTPLIQQIEHKFSGVLNGIDTAYWNPATDPLLPAHFSVHERKNKALVKQELRRRLDLADSDAPLVTAITRLVPQKGPELIKSALLHTLEKGGQFVLLGSAPDEATHEAFYNLKRTLAGSHHVHLELTFNEELSHLVYGASDLFIIPSLFEPCGLTQMIAMHYGSVPLVRKTGGLADTVHEGENGFVFEEPTPEAINEALDRAFATWNTPAWEELVNHGMQKDVSWKGPAEEYLEIYQSSCLSR